ncbi:MAG: FtsX-like permease family protein [Bacteroidota bacterium]
MHQNISKEQIVCIPFEKGLKGTFQAYQNELENQVGIEKMATSSMSIFKRGVNIFFVTSPFNEKEIGLQTMNVNTALLDLFKLKWAEEPSDFNRIGADNTIILNEKAKREFGKEEIVGEGITLGGKLSKEVIGIIEDFHYQSLEAEIPPLAIQIVEEPSFFEYFGGAFYVKFINDQNLSAQLQQLETIHEKFSPDQPFEYYFLDEVFGNYYRKEVQLGKMLGIFTGFAVFIACLGLFGLITYTTQQRSKEVGIRKVLGASALSIVRLFSMDFVKLVLISLIIASAIAWYFMHQWLQDFNYRTDIQWWVFALSGFLVLVIAMLTVGLQSIKTALMNPVKSLRNE